MGVDAKYSLTWTAASSECSRDVSGRRDLNPRPLDPQDVAVGVLAGQSWSEMDAGCSIECLSFGGVHGVWSLSGPHEPVNDSHTARGGLGRQGGLATAVPAAMRRSYRGSPLFPRILRLIWHASGTGAWGASGTVAHACDLGGWVGSGRCSATGLLYFAAVLGHLPTDGLGEAPLFEVV
jgi:hypothetical protein